MSDHLSAGGQPVFGGVAVVLRSSHLEVMITPLGGKIVSLRSRPSGREWLWQHPAAPEPVPAALPRAESASGANLAGPAGPERRYDAWDSTGFDECLPTLAAARYPDPPWRGADLGDHGLLWDRWWETRVEPGAVISEVRVTIPPLRFRRCARITGPSTLRLEYEITAEGDQPVSFVYSPHPLLALEAGSHLVLPPGMNRMWLRTEGPVRIGRTGQWVSWPQVPVSTGYWDFLGPWDPNRGHAAKFFSPRIAGPEQAWVRLQHPLSDESITVRFDPDGLPYLGLWFCQGRPAPGANRGHGGTSEHGQSPGGEGWKPAPLQFCLGIEPTSALGATIEEARHNGGESTVVPGRPYRFWMEFQVENHRRRPGSGQPA